MNEMRVASIAFAAYLRQLGAGAVHHEHRRARPRERRVQLAMMLSRASVLGADHHAVGFHEVLDRRALLQELRVADDAERVGGFPPNDLAHLLGGADGYGALIDDDLVSVHRPAISRATPSTCQVGGAILVLRRADRDEDDLAALRPPLEDPP